MEIRSSAFHDHHAIPRRFTCEGEDVSPPLSWSEVPPDTASLALIIDDPDAPDPANPRVIWVHWLLYNLPPDTRALEAAATPPGGTGVGLNDWKRTDYGGPCPPIGRHRYFHRLYALDTRLQFDAPPTRDQLDRAMAGHVLAQAELVGTYEKVEA